MVRGRQFHYTEGLHARLAYDDAARARKGLSLWSYFYKAALASKGYFKKKNFMKCTTVLVT